LVEEIAAASGTDGAPEGFAPEASARSGNRRAREALAPSEKEEFVFMCGVSGWVA
jgi:hypothetical protein